MEEEPEPELGKAYLDELAAVFLEIDSLPLVNSVAPVGQPGDKLTNIKVRANLNGEFVDPKKNRRPAFCLSKERPTQLHAARALLAMLRSSEKGGYAEELAAAEAAAAGGSSATTESSHGILAPLPWLPCLAVAALRFARDPFSHDDSRPARAATAASRC
jgi:hypothetical protein